ncbi:hypothetical protein HYFRA_00006927 [Hymenoscyphus fraxineus]|uniref:J domain-containing protein n=1 Tax=Hymenoscyphus fraxineus TaxID=746836 RepID=A0A9N9KNX6_9HELO|nr:hypothetical protein HYFRA_00006927 [Hymenoscyphus fraxineus]
MSRLLLSNATRCRCPHQFRPPSTLIQTQTLALAPTPTDQYHAWENARARRNYFNDSTANEPRVPDHYRILGVARNATPEEIKAAWLKRRKFYHPDRNPDKSAKDNFIIVNDSYAILKDPGLKRNADEIWKRQNPENVVKAKQEPMEKSQPKTKVDPVATLRQKEIQRNLEALQREEARLRSEREEAKRELEKKKARQVLEALQREEAKREREKEKARQVLEDLQREEARLRSEREEAKKKNGQQQSEQAPREAENPEEKVKAEAKASTRKRNHYEGSSVASIRLKTIEARKQERLLQETLWKQELMAEIQEESNITNPLNKPVHVVFVEQEEVQPQLPDEILADSMRLHTRSYQLYFKLFILSAVALLALFAMKKVVDLALGDEISSQIEENRILLNNLEALLADGQYLVHASLLDIAHRLLETERFINEHADWLNLVDKNIDGVSFMRDIAARRMALGIKCHELPSQQQGVRKNIIDISSSPLLSRFKPPGSNPAVK